MFGIVGQCEAVSNQCRNQTVGKEYVDVFSFLCSVCGALFNIIRYNFIVIDLYITLITEDYKYLPYYHLVALSAILGPFWCSSCYEFDYRLSHSYQCITNHRSSLGKIIKLSIYSLLDLYLFLFKQDLKIQNVEILPEVGTLRW